MVTGARQVGKTTLAQDKYPALRYLSLDAVENREALRLLPTSRWGKEVGAAILDEAHKEPSVFEKLKYAYDAREVAFSVLLGSAQILMLGGVRETLAGRVFVYELWPLTVSELAVEKGSKPSLSLLARLVEHGGPVAEIMSRLSPMLIGEGESRPQAAVEHLAQWGGMPELVELTADERRQWLRSYNDTYLQRDLADLVRLRDLAPFVKLQRLTALRVGNLLSYSELARDAGTSPTTARNYLEYLRLSYQAVLLQPYHENLTSSVIKSPKVYWSDVGILRQIAAFWGPVTGQLFENLAVAEVIKLIRTCALDGEPYFYRTRSGMEVDLLLRMPAGLLCLEMKNRDRAVARDLRPMRTLAETIGQRFLGGLVVTNGGLLKPLDEAGRFWAVPLHRLLT
jgi:predicted AAA+ superfamily ATPase